MAVISNPVEAVEDALQLLAGDADALAAELADEGGEGLPELERGRERPCAAVRCVEDVGAAAVRIGGSAKGAGMIHPNMATLLAFVTTDAAVDPTFLQTALERAVESAA